VAVSTLPTRAELEAVAARLGMRVEEDARAAESGGEDFYLYTLHGHGEALSDSSTIS
jgi:hypothetical protein